MLPSLLLSLLVLAKNHTKTTHIHSEHHWFTRCAVCGMHSWYDRVLATCAWLTKDDQPNNDQPHKLQY